MFHSNSVYIYSMLVRLSVSVFKPSVPSRPIAVNILKCILWIGKLLPVGNVFLLRWVNSCSSTTTLVRCYSIHLAEWTVAGDGLNRSVSTTPVISSSQLDVNLSGARIRANDLWI